MSDRVPFRVQPMLATLVRAAFHEPGWVYEEKYDGYRILAYKEGKRVTLLSRNAKDRTEWFAGVAQAVKALKARALLLDGEVVAFDRRKVSRFQLLQEQSSRGQYAVFDCLYSDGLDLRREPLARRREVLESVIGAGVKNGGRIFLSARLAPNGLKAYEIAQRKGLEGVLAKDASSPYVEGRSRFWLKFKVHQEDEFVILGYTAPEGTREHFGALLLGAYDTSGDLVYVGKVGTGFTRGSLAELYRKFQPFVRAKSAGVDLPRERGVTYVVPRFVAQIAYQEMTSDRKLRQPVFLGLRDDKLAADVTIPEPV